LTTRVERPTSAGGRATLAGSSGLAAGYGRGEPAIREVSFAARAGEAVAVLGPNGGGKTTLLRALVGELRPVAGSVLMRGRPAYVPQLERTRLDFPVRALDVALMGTWASLPWYRRAGAVERERARAALERVGLRARQRVAFGDLSGGERQRVLIARALAQDARVLLLDEPLAGVDRLSAARILAVLGELRGEGRCVLVATHDADYARGLDSVLCLNRRQVAFGPPAEVLDRGALEATYGPEIIVLEGGDRAVAVHHHDR
jgi:ABC-type Mn2+/Zn2+ transport system ATPase subunit